jgi:uncharacterized protein
LVEEDKEAHMLMKEAKKILSDHKKELLKLGVRALSLFGSVARNKASAGSDVDILVDFNAKKGLFAFMGLKNYLEELLHCNVDLVTKSALHPALRKRILHEAKNVFKVDLKTSGIH